MGETCEQLTFSISVTAGMLALVGNPQPQPLDPKSPIPLSPKP